MKTALYYPSIALNNVRLIKTMSLYYDSIFRIVPNGVRPEDSAELQPLLEDDRIGRMIDPSPYSQDASAEFINKLDDWDAAALVPGDEDDLARLHTGKMDEEVRRLFLDAGYDENADWLTVPTSLASNYMLYLANIIASKNNLELLTSEWGAWTGTNYFSVDGEIDEYLMPPNSGIEFEEDTLGLFSLMIDELVPINIEEIPSEKIIEFREKRRDEILRFHKVIEDLKLELSKTDANEVSQERVEATIKDLKKAMKDFKKSARSLKVQGWAGTFLSGISAPIYLLNVFGVPVESVIKFGAGSIGLGGMYNIMTTKNKLKELRKRNPSSMLIEMHSSFKKYRKNKPINQHAWRCMEEYVND